MAQMYQPDFDKLIRGESIETDEAQILAEVRKLMLAETVDHPEVTDGRGRLFRRKAQPQPQTKQMPDPEPDTAGEAETAKPGITTRGFRWLTAYHPRWSHNLMIFALAATLYSPLTVVFILVGALVLMLALVLLVGLDRLVATVSAGFALFERFLPGPAARLLAWTDTCSAKAQALADRLPARWTQGLYLPSFATQDSTDLDTIEPFDRLLADRFGDR